MWPILEHIRTHLDAPAHFIASGRPSPEMTPGELVAAIVVVDISRAGARARGRPPSGKALG